MGNEEITAARNLELYRLHTVEFELTKGDTLVFVDFPPVTNSLARQTDCNGRSYQPQKLRVHSEKLLATGSSKFIDMLSPTYQFRAQRRRGLVNKLPEGVKYVLDMTPPFEGDDLVFQMTELSLTPGITKWWTSQVSYQVDKWIVDGHDDVCACKKEAAKTSKTAEEAKNEDGRESNSTTKLPELPEMVSRVKKDQGLNPRFPKFRFATKDFIQMRADGDNIVHDIPAYRNIPDYCPIRHRNAIIRLLMLIEGHEVNMHSACRIWTMTKLSMIWDCTSITRDWVTQWIMYGPNSIFIEVLPEEALQIGFTLELPQVTLCAFRILVNELALKETADPDSLKGWEKTSAFGRTLGDIPDELSNLVQHAARALVERISAIAHKLDNFPTVLKSSKEYRKLAEIEQLSSLHPSTMRVAQQAQEIMDALDLDFEAVYEKAQTIDMGQPPIYYKSMDLDRITHVEPMNFVMTETVIYHFNDIQKLLCPFIYNDLGIELDSGLFFRETQGWSTARHTSYPMMVGKLNALLQKAVLEQPDVMTSGEWSGLIDRYHELSTTPPLFGFLNNPLDIKKLEKEVKEVLRPIILSWIRHDIEPQLNITRYLLLTLTNDELKFLPLWAGGCNDGSGGVFQAFVPDTEMGPNGPGPAYHTGITIPSNPSSISGSMLDDMRTMRVMGSTTAGSVDVHDSISTVYRPDRVIADDVSLASESFTAGGSDYQAARFEAPAEHQGIGQALDTLVDTTDTESDTTTTEMDFMTDDNDEDEDMSFWEDSDDQDTDVEL